MYITKNNKKAKARVNLRAFFALGYIVLFYFVIIY